MVSSQRLRILIICPFFRPNVGGVETRFSDICDELDRMGHSVTVLTYQPLVTRAKGMPVERKGNVTIYRFWWIGSDLFHKLIPYPALEILYLAPVLFIRSLIYVILNSKNIDVIHTPGFTASLIGRVFKPFFKKKWVVSTHSIYNLDPDALMGRMIRWILHKADAILTLSELSRQELIKAGINPAKIVNQITWVNQDIFKPMDRGACRREIGHKNDFIVLFTGRLLEDKGIRELADVAIQTPNIDYLFVGSGPLKGFLEKKSKESGNIRFLSFIENRELPRYYNAADIFIMPSQCKEGLGRVIVEALACGTPVISSNRGGIADVVDDSVAVLIDPTRENIKAAISGLYNNPEKLRSMRKYARPFAEKVFSSRNIEVIISAYS